MDPLGRDGGGALTAAGLSCGSCGTELPPDSRFCNKCGTPITPTATSAEYKQVTVLFADVVHSMDLAAAVGAERLREIMAELADRCAAVVQRYGGTVDKFTGDGIMAVFGAPVALEDHAIRACLAALGAQEDAKRLAVEVQERDGVDLQSRVGLNSGQVITGEIGSGSFGYTAIGEQVGMAQRMESVAPPGGVMLSASTARVVDGSAALGEPEMVWIKGADRPVAAQRLLGMGERRDGKKIVDLWGGYRNGITKEPWQEDTIATAFSTPKGVASLAVAVAASRGIISYDAKVADYWPEFAQAGKESVTVRQLLSHQAGLPVISPPLTLDDLANPTRMSAKLAAQRPAWAPERDTATMRSLSAGT